MQQVIMDLLLQNGRTVLSHLREAYSITESFHPERLQYSYVGGNLLLYYSVPDLTIVLDRVPFWEFGNKATYVRSFSTVFEPLPSEITGGYVRTIDCIPRMR